MKASENVLLGDRTRAIAQMIETGQATTTADLQRMFGECNPALSCLIGRGEIMRVGRGRYAAVAQD